MVFWWYSVGFRQSQSLRVIEKPPVDGFMVAFEVNKLASNKVLQSKSITLINCYKLQIAVINQGVTVWQEI